MEETKEKEKFYVFSGIGNTLMGKDYLKSKYGAVGMEFGYKKADKRCVDALNYLLASLEEKYDAKLVITSRRRKDHAECLKFLRVSGLEYDKPIYFTKFVEGLRGEKIIRFLELQGATPLDFHKEPLYVRFLKNFKDNPDFKNYVVLNEPTSNISRYIPKSQYKKVDPRKGFTKNDANEILIANGIKPKVAESQKQ